GCSRRIHRCRAILLTAAPPTAGTEATLCRHPRPATGSVDRAEHARARCRACGRIVRTVLYKFSQQTPPSCRRVAQLVSLSAESSPLARPLKDLRRVAERKTIRSIHNVLQKSPVSVDHSAPSAEPTLTVCQQNDDAARAGDDVGALCPHTRDLVSRIAQEPQAPIAGQRDRELGGPF